ncbi:hypothetical protein CCP3SC15_290027 [Gammaproteobacteria bacterium]
MCRDMLNEKTEIIHARVSGKVKDKLSELADAETRSLTNMLVVLIEREYARTVHKLNQVLEAIH